VRETYPDQLEILSIEFQSPSPNLSLSLQSSSSNLSLSVTSFSTHFLDG